MKGRRESFFGKLSLQKKIMENEVKHSNFIHDIIDVDLQNNPELKIHTRFPPEPNGYLHIGSVKAICVNTDVANKYNGLFNLRYDDTNPAKESDEFVRSIREDLEWLGATPTGGVYYGSDYFGKCYEFAVQLIKQGDAYVCDLTKDEIADYKGTDRSQASKESPYRNRTVEENLALFERMKNGETVALDNDMMNKVCEHLAENFMNYLFRSVNGQASLKVK